MDSDWTPTMKLRFVNRKASPHPISGVFGGPTTFKILQQWWENGALKAVGTAGEWRDVPLEME